MRFGSLLSIKLFKSDAFGRLRGRFALKIGCRKQPRDIKGPSHAKGAENDAKWTPGGCLLEHPGARKTAPTCTKGVIWHAYVKCLFCNASWATFCPKPRRNGIAKIVFGLHRRERIAYLLFSEKVVPGAAFSSILTSFRVPDGAKWSTFGPKSGPVWQVASVSLSELWNLPQTSPTSSHVRGQSLSKRQVI